VDSLPLACTDTGVIEAADWVYENPAELAKRQTVPDLHLRLFTGDPWAAPRVLVYQAEQSERSP